MTNDAAHAELQQVPVKSIERNVENPRIIFRQDELDDLLDSIATFGIQVPISVYREGRQKFVLIDGERRWRCALKLNMETIPALVQDKPTKLDNVLLMFNIHALREQWDLLTIALKLRDVLALLAEKKGADPTENDVANATGLPRATIRRCRYLLDLPPRYHSIILSELAKPKSKQRLTEDLFIEMEKALRTVERSMPDIIPNKDDVRRVLLAKFRDKVIDNRVNFRQVAKIARAENVDADPAKAESVLRKLFERNSYSINDAFKESVSDAYEEREILNNLTRLITHLRSLDPEAVDDRVRSSLKSLKRVIETILEAGQ